jgi:DNA-binding transcriptional LysR family regulator
MARLILEQVDVLVATAKSNGRGEAGRLSIGFCTSISAGNLRTTLTEFKNRHPRIELATVERSQTRLAMALRNGTADVLIVTGDGPLPNNNVRLLWSERILVSLPEDHVLAAGTVVYWTDLRNETVLLSQHDPGPELEDLLISKLVSPADRPKIEHHDVSRCQSASNFDPFVGVNIAGRMTFWIRVCPGTSSRIAKLSEHESD